MTQYGQIHNDVGAKCVIFPKGKTTWEGFHVPFRDGDIVAGENCSFSYITIFRKFIDDISFSHHVCLTSFGKFKVDGFSDNKNLRLATEEEKQKLFDAIKVNGYKWNFDTKTLEKLIEPKFKVGDRIKKGEKIAIVERVYKDSYNIRFDIDGGIGAFTIDLQDEWELVSNKFDITTLIPFESKVLVRDTEEEKWKPAIWGYYDVDHIKYYPYETVGGNCFCLCIPYEGNEHLLGTNDNCDDFYKTCK